jgi:predicted AlkP superfamily pyrophosphatase or phosphodiesterase
MITILRRLCAALTFFVLVAPAVAADAPERTVVVVMFDGFPPAMIDATSTPNFDRMKREGVWSRHLVPAFPTLSMTNHATFVTGCWPAHHGIMSNIFYDPQRGRYDDHIDPADSDWRTGCETMWQAAERQGVKSAVFNFVDRWSHSRGKLASIVNPEVPWEQHESDDKIVARGLAELADNSPNHPRLIALYFPIPDHVGHFNGTTAPKTEEAVRRCDAIVGKLMAAIKALPPGREGTLVVGTDHGMMDVGPLINVGRLMNKYSIVADQASDGGIALLYLHKGESAERVATALSPYSYAFDVYRKGHYPAFAHLGNGPRAGDVMLVAKPPYWFVGPEIMPWWGKLLGVTYFWPVTFTPFVGGLKADHGFDPRIVQMHGIFYAWGAGIAKGKEIPRLDMIDIHPTVMALLGLQPGRPVDGHVVSAALAQ